MNKYQEAMLAEAIRYVHQGWYVFPCHWKKHPLTANGFYDATVHEEQIMKWWEQNPDALIGIRTGEESGFWVIDVDMKNGKDGLTALTDYFRNDFDLDLDDHLWQKTATGGFHFCFKYDDVRPVGCATNILPGVDVRGDGGYIIAAPSSIKVGDKWKQYRWKDINVEPKDAPEWAYELLSLRPQNKQRLDLDSILREGVAEDARDTSIFRIACMLEREGVDCSTAMTFVEILAERCFPPFDKAVARAKVESAYNTDYSSITGLRARIEMLDQEMMEMDDGE